jgi:glycosyltransferase involved in cell wall biosynthesis
MNWARNISKKNFKKTGKPIVLMVGPYPPPIGGVSTFLENCLNSEELNDNFKIEIFRHGKRSSKIPNLVQACLEIFLILKFFALTWKNNYDIIHIHTPSYWGFFRNIPYILFSKNFIKTKVIIHIHGGGFSSFYENSTNPIKNLIKYTLISSDLIIVTSVKWIEIVKDIVDEHKNICAIHNGYNKNQFYPIPQEIAREKLNLPTDRTIIMAIGNYHEGKGYKYLIRSLFEVKKYKNDILCLIIGNMNSSNGILQNEITLLNLNENIKLIGKIPHDQLLMWINSCDIFVLSSLMEGTPTVMYECIACGKPLIGTNVGGVSDIITSSEYGLICEPGNHIELAKILCLSLSKKWNSRKIANYSQQFSWNNTGLKLASIYTEQIK